MEVIHRLSGSELDLIIHSPGGSAESTEALVSYLRSKFNNIRVIVRSMRCQRLPCSHALEIKLFWANIHFLAQ